MPVSPASKIVINVHYFVVVVVVVVIDVTKYILTADIMRYSISIGK